MTGVSRCPHGLCWCDGWHHTADGLTLCPNGQQRAVWARLFPDISDIGPGPEWYSEQAYEAGVDVLAGVVARQRARA
jgi:hypothetical protein